MYNDPNPASNPLFDQYHVTLLIVRDMERYGLETCQKAGQFESIAVAGYPGLGWTLVYDQGDQNHRRDGT
jgi:hypothetical protein